VVVTCGELPAPLRSGLEGVLVGTSAISVNCPRNRPESPDVVANVQASGGGGASEPGDVDGDGDVDIDDVMAILGNRGTSPAACPACDLDGDGRITVLDARQAVVVCNLPRCTRP
jgi:hypothetical protein